MIGPLFSGSQDSVEGPGTMPGTPDLRGRPSVQSLCGVCATEGEGSRRSASLGLWLSEVGDNQKAAHREKKQMEVALLFG